MSTDAGSCPYWRPLLQHGPARPGTALTLAGGWTWFTHVERLERGAPPRVLPADALPEDWRARLTAPRPPLPLRAGLPGPDAARQIDWTAPRLMGVLNVTPDSFSDGGAHLARADAVARARQMATEVDLIDIGGESTRPGAAELPADEEIARVMPVLRELTDADARLPPLSIDTRKAAVAEAALAAGAAMVNDVSALAFDPAMAGVVAREGVPVCLMHAKGPPETMQHDPRYGDVLLDVYDALAAQVAEAEAAGIARARIVVDPGIGFGKTGAHNLALLARLSLFHGLGLPVLVGASRKRFIGVVGGDVAGGGQEVPGGAARAPGSVAVALAAFGQGAQIARVHDTGDTVQALRLWRAVSAGRIV